MSQFNPRLDASAPFQAFDAFFCISDRDRS
jgi:hypothetical protein